MKVNDTDLCCFVEFGSGLRFATNQPWIIAAPRKRQARSGWKTGWMAGASGNETHPKKAPAPPPLQVHCHRDRHRNRQRHRHHRTRSQSRVSGPVPRRSSGRLPRCLAARHKPDQAKADDEQRPILRFGNRRANEDIIDNRAIVRCGAVIGICKVNDVN